MQDALKGPGWLAVSIEVLGRPGHLVRQFGGATLASTFDTDNDDTNNG